MNKESTLDKKLQAGKQVPIHSSPPASACAFALDRAIAAPLLPASWDGYWRHTEHALV